MQGTHVFKNGACKRDLGEGTGMIVLQEKQVHARGKDIIG